MAQHSAGVSGSRPQLLFLQQKQNIRAWQQQSKKHCIENKTWRNSASNKNIQKQLERTTIKLCLNPVIHKRSKHIETKLHFIQAKTEDGTISFHYVPTEKMAADIFTKSLSVSKVGTFRTVLMGTDSTQSTQV